MEQRRHANWFGISPQWNQCENSKKRWLDVQHEKQPVDLIFSGVIHRQPTVRGKDGGKK